MTSRSALALALCVLLPAAGRAVEEQTVARVYLVDYMPGVDCVFSGTVTEGGVNRAMMKVERPVAGTAGGEALLVVGFNTVEVNSSHYRLKKGMQRLIAGYRRDEKVFVPSPYSGCFPVEGGRVVLFPYRGASAVAVPHEAVLRLMTAFFEGGEKFNKSLMSALDSASVEERYLALIFAGFSTASSVRERLLEYAGDDNPVLREASSVALALSAPGPGGIPEPGALDAQGIAAVWRVLKCRLDRCFGSGMGLWVPAVASFVGAAEEIYDKGDELPAEVRTALNEVVNEGLDYLWLAAPFNTARVGELMAYRRLKAAVLQILAASTDETRLPLIAAFIDDGDPQTAMSAATAARRIRCEFTSIVADVSSGGRWRNVRRLEVMPDDLRAVYMNPGLHCGDYALFRLGTEGLIKGNEFPSFGEVYWRDLAYPSVLPEAMLLPFGSSLERRLDFFDVAVPLVRRFPEAAPVLEYWIRVLGELGGAYEKEVAIKAVASLPEVPADLLKIIHSGLLCEASSDVRRAAFNTAQRLGLPLLYYRFMEDPDLNRDVLAAAAALWKPIKHQYRPSDLPFEKKPAAKDESYPVLVKALVVEGSGRALLPQAETEREAAFAAAGITLDYLRDGGRFRPVEASEMPFVAQAILRGYGLAAGRTGAKERGIARRAALFGKRTEEASPQGREVPGELYGADLALAVAGAVYRGEFERAWQIYERNVEGADEDSYRLVSSCLAVPAMIEKSSKRTDLLVRLLEHPNTYTRMTAAATLHVAGHVPDTKTIRRLLTSEIPGLYSLGADLAGLAGDEDLLPSLGVLLETLDPFIQLRAADAAAEIGGPKAASMISAARKEAFDEAVKSLLLEPLTACHRTGLYEGMNVLAGSNWNARYYVVLGLGRARYPEAKKKLLELYLDSSERLSALAESCILQGNSPGMMLDVLREHREAEGVSILIRALEKRTSTQEEPRPPR